MGGLFKKRTEKKDEAGSNDPAAMPEPTDLQGLMRRGWAYHSRGLNEQAEADFRQAIEMAPDSVDAHYVLGLVLKARQQKDQAIGAFKKVVELVEGGDLEDKARSEMLRRLALGHINEISEGDWNLEQEIWHRES
jgi:tetratricopeptide (TPR) repeat protein